MHLYTILLVVGIVTAATAKPCCMPDKYEMVMAQTTGYVQHGEPGIVQAHSFVSMDVSERKTALFVNEILNNGTLLKTRIIADYNKGVAYFIQNEKCTKAKSGPYQPPCVPATAKFVNRFTMGAEGSKMFVNAYKILDGQLTSYLSVTDECIAVGSQSFGSTETTTGIFDNIGFLNVTIGIRDPSVFVVPKICNEGTPFHMEQMPDIGGHNIFLGGWSTKKMNNKM